MQEKIGHPQLISVLTKDGRSLKPGVDGKPVRFKLATDTTVNFLSTHHDIVFAVDVSFSTISSVSATCLLSLSYVISMYHVFSEEQLYTSFTVRMVSVCEPVMLVSVQC